MKQGLLTKIDRIDDLVFEFYKDLDVEFLKEKPEYRFLLVSPLLNNLCSFNLSNNDYSYNKLLSEIKSTATTTFNKSASICSEIQSIIGQPTYFAASYWSPIDRNRHTISHSKEKESLQIENDARAAALLFYILTLKAPQKGFHSAINFISTESPRKDGLHSYYGENEPLFNIPFEKQYQIWWHIPNSIHIDLLNCSGFALALEKLSSINIKIIERSLTIIMENLDSEIVENEIRKYDNIYNPILENINTLKIPQNLYKWGISFKNYLNNFFYPSDLNKIDQKELTLNQCFFMACTHALYNSACPTKMFYTFPVRISDNCCVLTLGVEKELELENILAMSHVVKSIYYHAVDRDYQALNALERNRLAHGAVHILRGPLNIFKQVEQGINRSLKPTLSDEEFRKVKNILAPRLSDFQIAYKQMQYGVDLMSSFIDYEHPEVYNLNDTIKESIKLFNNNFMDSFSSIEFISNESEAFTFGITSHTKFILGELIYNSMRVFSFHNNNNDKKLKIKILLDSDNSYNYINFIDNGIGIKEEYKLKIFKSGFSGDDSGGSGKGLFLAKLFLNKYHGDITEIGKLNEGAIFKLSYLKCKEK